MSSLTPETDEFYQVQETLENKGNTIKINRVFPLEKEIEACYWHAACLEIMLYEMRNAYDNLLACGIEDYNMALTESPNCDKEIEVTIEDAQIIEDVKSEIAGPL